MHRNEIEGSKECCKCHIVKPYSEYYRNSQAKDGLRFRCIPCWKEDYRRRHPKEVLPEGHKRCNGCRSVKPLSEFNNVTRERPFAYQCRECMASRTRVWYANNKEHVEQRQAAYRQTEKGKQTMKRTMQRQNQLYPEKMRARRMVNYAVRIGRLDKPNECTNCGETGRIEGHHEDYTKPLDVLWLCGACHKTYHGVLAYETI